MFTLLLPNVNTRCMNIFLEEFSKFIGTDQKAVILMDGAGWHKSHDLVIPSNVRIIIQPPYSPELNPVEKLWQYIKNHTIKNKIYITLDALELAVCQFLNCISKNDIKTICNINYIPL